MKGSTTASTHTVTALPDTCLLIVRRPGPATTGWDAEGVPPGKSWREGKTASHSRARAGLHLVPSGSRVVASTRMQQSPLSAHKTGYQHSAGRDPLATHCRPAGQAASERVVAGIGWPSARIASTQPRMASRPLVIASSIVSPSEIQPGDRRARSASRRRRLRTAPDGEAVIRAREP
jgi:hypothetical protein